MLNIKSYSQWFNSKQSWSFIFHEHISQNLNKFTCDNSFNRIKKQKIIEDLPLTFLFLNSRLRKSSWNNTIKKWDMLLDSKANFLLTLTVTVLCIFSQLRCFIFPGLFCPTLNIEILDDNFYAKYFCFLTLFQITKFLWNTDYDIRELYIVCRIKKSLTFIL